MTDDFAPTATDFDLYGPAMEMTEPAQAGAYLERLVLRAQRLQGLGLDAALEQERTNLGYFAGNCSHETRIRVEQLFGAVHPLLGSALVGGPVSAQAAFDIGMAAGLARSGRLN